MDRPQESKSGARHDPQQIIPHRHAQNRKQTALRKDKMMELELERGQPKPLISNEANAAIGCLTTVFIIIAILYSTYCAYRLGIKHGEQAMQERAVLEGHAEYISAEDGSPLWQWKK